MGGSVAVDSSVGLGSIFSFQVLFALASASRESAEHMLAIRSPRPAIRSPSALAIRSPNIIAIRSPSALDFRSSSEIATLSPTPRPSSNTEIKFTVASTSVPSVTESAGKSQMFRAPVLQLRFLVVDDNELNKSMFERTVNNMFKDRAKPVYTFAANGL
jgi:hypothetical protein